MKMSADISARLGLNRLLGDVPCNGCTYCCHGDAVRILPTEDLTQYQVERHPYFSGCYMIAHKPNGDCIYLEANGCTIHDRKPQQCREMDCRRIAATMTFTNARKLHKQRGLPLVVWRKGKDLLSLLSA